MFSQATPAFSESERFPRVGKFQARLFQDVLMLCVGACNLSYPAYEVGEVSTERA